jgi:hypothetical protein
MVTRPQIFATLTMRLLLLLLVSYLTACVALVATPAASSLRSTQARPANSAWVRRPAAQQSLSMLDKGRKLAPKIIIAGAPASGKGTQVSFALRFPFQRV